ncbi:LPS export ABC transporter periplasmic protein LptC [Aquimarina rhabdastrellae]
MRKSRTYIFLNLVTAFAVTLFFSCTESKQANLSYVDYSEQPMAEGENVNLKYTDSGKLKAVLTSQKMLDFTNKTYGYHEFPDGVLLRVYDEKGGISVIKADYAISYKQSGLVDMRGNVDIKTADSTHLEAQQLYWDQRRDWVFTDLPYKSKLSNGAVNNGDGFDANQDFTTLNSRINEGIQILEE